MTSEGISALLPSLTDEQLAVVVRRGTRHVTTSGEVLYQAGDRGYDFIVIETGEVDVVLPAMPDTPETLIATWGPGRFLGELNLLTGQTAIATARVRAPGVVYRLEAARFRELMAEDADLSALVLRVLLARRLSLRSGDGARALRDPRQPDVTRDPRAAHLGRAAGTTTHLARFRRTGRTGARPRCRHHRGGRSSRHHGDGDPAPSHGRDRGRSHRTGLPAGRQS